MQRRIIELHPRPQVSSGVLHARRTLALVRYSERLLDDSEHAALAFLRAALAARLPVSPSSLPPAQAVAQLAGYLATHRVGVPQGVAEGAAIELALAAAALWGAQVQRLRPDWTWVVLNGPFEDWDPADGPLPPPPGPDADAADGDPEFGLVSPDRRYVLQPIPWMSDYVCGNDDLDLTEAVFARLARTVLPDADPGAYHELDSEDHALDA